jgi:DNA polymerase/3'-5' exonuclease PolX
MQLALIQPIAQTLVDQLSSACVRIEIKGSIIRRKPDAGDIDLVCIPSLGHYSIIDLFGAIVEEHAINHLEQAIELLIDSDEWELDPVVKRNGPHGKRLRHRPTGICADLAITDRRHWGMIATLRTGPGDFSKALVTLARQRGWQVSEGLLHGHPPVDYDVNGKAKPCPRGSDCQQVIETPEEVDVFAKLKLPWIEPYKRNMNMFWAARGAVR